MTKQEISLLLGLIFTILVSLCGQDIKTAADIRQNTLRLHIIANSDSYNDQQIKLAVRDKILDMGQIFADAEDYTAAVRNTAENMAEIESSVNSFLMDENIPYTASCSLENFYFGTRQYSGFALPQGEYTAVTVRLGKAQGKNWWCVIYPALCSQSCGQLALENSDDFIKTEKITARFKIVELAEEIKRSFSADKAPEYDN
ncbi:MAG: stage II sporulation protein R [Oscillospiraceae bacterium]|nr:stage II sporulation protein R [Oscillospiraceae bacterium]